MLAQREQDCDRSRPWNLMVLRDLVMPRTMMFDIITAMFTPPTTAANNTNSNININNYNNSMNNINNITRGW